MTFNGKFQNLNSMVFLLLNVIYPFFCYYEYGLLRGRPFDPEGGGGWQIWSGQIIYFHHGLGQKIYFQVNRGQNIYFQPQQFFEKAKKKKKRRGDCGGGGGGGSARVK